MAYSTGSGDYNALFAAILAHAIGDGWTEAGGLGTGFPITSPSGNTHFDWSSWTATENNVTVGGGGGTITSRYARLGIGSSAANATSNAASTATSIPNMHYTFTEWHIFSEPAVSDHINVVVGFTNGPNADCWTSFSFGELDKNGLTYGGVSFATGTRMRGWAVTTDSGQVSSNDWNFGVARMPWGWNGIVGRNGYNTETTLSWMVQSTTAPTPNGAGGWPAHDVVQEGGSGVWNKCSYANSNETAVQYHGLTTANLFRGVNHDAMSATPPSQTGTVSLMPMPFLAIDGTGTASKLRYLGVFPNTRMCSMAGVNPGDEITYGSETWKLFPLLRKTDPTQAQLSGVVSSALAGIAFKKVI